MVRDCLKQQWLLTKEQLQSGWQLWNLETWSTLQGMKARQFNTSKGVTLRQLRWPLPHLGSSACLMVSLSNALFSYKLEKEGGTNCVWYISEMTWSLGYISEMTWSFWYISEMTWSFWVIDILFFQWLSFRMPFLLEHSVPYRHSYKMEYFLQGKIAAQHTDFVKQ